ncbi:Uncharacterized protein SSP1546 [Geodia barretti]|uniref:Uncharacterized protein SSP1546 n=1 Tax=Geodia barretti TaxID=519541 RepID=A0AA35SLC5_GEOBA|nr:Uncharacterized protein SSP1546 [Geodia barretti]
MFTAGAQVLESHVNLVNRLNVFPVQDGDTGINMLLTLRDTLAEARSAEGDAADAIAKSDVGRGVHGGEGQWRFHSIPALQRAHAYNAIGNPVEGTMLTVFTYAADAAVKSAEVGSGADDMLTSVSDAAREAVIITPTLLPRLQEAGVVDSGGLGLWMILEGVRRWVAGDDTSPDELDMPLPEGIDVSESGVSLEFLDLTEDEEYGNCTQFVIRGEGLDVDGVRVEMSTRGRSAVVIGDASLVKVHVHTEVPDEILEYARALGSVSRVSVENMDEQRERLAAKQRQQAEDALAQVIPIPVLAVAWGDGLEAVFRHEGASGVAAILEFQPYRSLDENSAEMEDVIQDVRTGEITRAARSVTLDGVTAEEGQLIGLFERQMVAAGEGLTETTLSILRSADVGDGDLVTLYRGDPITEAEANDVVAEVQSAFPSIDLQHYYGGQPFYHFILSIE